MQIYIFFFTCKLFSMPPKNSCIIKLAHLTDGKGSTDAIITPVDVQCCPPGPPG